jgi:hypothetical protein
MHRGHACRRMLSSSSSLGMLTVMATIIRHAECVTRKHKWLNHRLIHLFHSLLRSLWIIFWAVFLVGIPVGCSKMAGRPHTASRRDVSSCCTWSSVNMPPWALWPFIHGLRTIYIRHLFSPASARFPSASHLVSSVGHHHRFRDGSCFESGGCFHGASMLAVGSLFIPLLRIDTSGISWPLFAGPWEGEGSGCSVGCLQLEGLIEGLTSVFLTPKGSCRSMSRPCIPSANARAASYPLRCSGSSAWVWWAEWSVAAANSFKDFPTSWGLLFIWECNAASRWWLL